MKSDDLKTIGETLIRVVTPDMTPKQLLKLARRAHPNASKKDVVRAAFYSMIVNADSQPSKAEKLQDFAIRERTTEDAEEPGA